MKIPPKGHPDDPDGIKDVFVIFASSGDNPPVSWGEICLPSLPVDSRSIEKLLDIERSDKLVNRDPGDDAKGKIKKKKSTQWTVLERVVKTIPG
jgi:hypothetical protein